VGEKGRPSKLPEIKNVVRQAIKNIRKQKKNI